VLTRVPFLKLEQKFTQIIPDSDPNKFSSKQQEMESNYDNVKKTGRNHRKIEIKNKKGV
jgi:hypothetical protein